MVRRSFFYGTCIILAVMLVSVIPVSAITQITTGTQIGQSNVISIQYNVNGVEYSYTGTDTSKCIIQTNTGEINICKNPVKTALSQWCKHTGGKCLNGKEFPELSLLRQKMARWGYNGR